MKQLTFTQITDSRFPHTDGIDIEQTLKDRVATITRNLETAGFKVAAGDIRKLNWPDGDIQFRCTFHVDKVWRKPFWSEAYGIVNRVKPVAFDFI